MRIAIRFKNYFVRYISVYVSFYVLNRTMNRLNHFWIMWFVIHVVSKPTNPKVNEKSH